MADRSTYISVYHCTGCNYTLNLKTKGHKTCLQCLIEQRPYNLVPLADWKNPQNGSEVV